MLFRMLGVDGLEAQEGVSGVQGAIPAAQRFRAACNRNTLLYKTYLKHAISA